MQGVYRGIYLYCNMYTYISGKSKRGENQNADAHIRFCVVARAKWHIDTFPFSSIAAQRCVGLAKLPGNARRPSRTMRTAPPPVAVALLLLVSHFCASSRALEPVILVPALAASVLNATLDSASPKKFPCRSTSNGSFTLYASAQQFTSQLACFEAHMSLVLDSSSGCADFPDGVDILPMDFGGVEGIRVLNVHDPPASQWGPLADLIDRLIASGYKPGHDLRGAPYDFRSWGDRCYYSAIINRISQLIVQTSLQNGNSSVTLVCHSMGCPLVHHLLLQSDSEWKGKFVTRIIAMAAPFAGAPDVIQSIIDGPIYSFVPVRIAHSLRYASGTWPSLLSLLPYNPPGISRPLYNASDIVLFTPSRNYSIADVPNLVQDIGPAGYFANMSSRGTVISPFANSWWGFIQAELWRSAEHPGVEVVCMFIEDVDTPFSFRYSRADLSDAGIVAENVRGDGTVPVFSSRDPCLQWAGEARPGISVTTQPFHLRGKANHASMPRSPVVIESVMQILLEGVSSTTTSSKPQERN